MQAHPQLKKIVSEIVMQDGKDAALPGDRFDYWRTFLTINFPRGDNHQLYGQLLTASIKFARYKATAAVQLFFLSALGLNSEQVEDNAKVMQVKLRQNERVLATKNLSGGLRPPSAIKKKKR